MLKRILCFLLVVLMLTAVLSACGGQTAVKPDEGSNAGEEQKAPTAAPVTEPETKSIIPAELPKFKIGVMYYTFTDKLGSQMKNALDYIADDFNVEFEYIEASWSAEAGQAAMETALQTGLDGIIAVSSGVAVLDACKKAGNVPFVSIQVEPIDNNVAADMSAYDCYLGAVSENDLQVGINAIEALHASGVRNLGVCGLTPGYARSHDDRIRGVKSAVKQKTDLTLVAEDYTLAEYAKSVSSFAAAYPEMDGLFVSQGVESIYQTMNTEGLIGSVKLAMVDISESTGDYFDNGTLVYIAGGQYGTTMIGFALLYNYLYDNTRIIPDTTVTLRRPFIEVKSSEEYEHYLKHVDGDIPVYTAEEIAQLIHGFNPEASYGSFAKASADYSLQDIVARHGDLK
ncbi:MAG: sugar ABC transporter substrate-binding protein [Ruminiclostridium sp.]|nr:sugar ABC transporter substrate-binding protein [Ruminiclostridium sp.]